MPRPAAPEGATRPTSPPGRRTHGARWHALPAFARLRRRVGRLSEPTALRLFRRALLSYGAHACGIYAGAMAFFGVLSLFPLLLLLITLVTIVVRRADASGLVLGRVTAFFPGSATLVIGTIDAVTAAQPVLLGIGTVGLLWSSMGVFLTLGYALNRIWEAPRDRHLLVQYAIAAGLALSVGILVLLSALLSALVALLHALEASLARLGVPGLGVLALVGSNVLDLVIVAGATAVLYRLLPNVAVRWRDVLPPAGVVAVAWEVAKLGFTWYLGAFAHVDRIYGPIAAIAGLMLWLFISSILLLLGAELAHQLARHRAEGAGSPAGGGDAAGRGRGRRSAAG